MRLSIAILLILIFILPGLASSTDWVALKENVRSKENCELMCKEYEKCDMHLSFGLPDDLSVENWKLKKQIYAKLNRKELEEIIAKEKRKDFLSASMLASDDNQLEELKIYLSKFGYKRLVIEHGQGIGWSRVYYDSLNHTKDDPKSN
ncbi:MAG: hypothetical protein IPG59_23160 [Candidatus Melainabacteria bacterium]|nr:MAG: hypothetical protein IPG59_23160 [Candidatus Melainabacteria bacterium]